MKKTTSRILILSFVIVFAVACTEKRAETFTQGQGTDLDSIASWKERTIPIKTGNVIGTAATTHAQDNVKVSEKVKSMNHFDLVQVKVDDSSLLGLIGNPPFRGLPNTSGVYELKIKLTDNYLKFYKVALPENLPFEEHAYLEEKLPDGRIAIPMLGYKINGYFHIEPVKTSDDQNSHHLTEIADIDHSKSTHVKIDWSSRELFEAVKTSDLLPASIFFSKGTSGGFKPYEWYYAETVIDKSLSDTGTIVGETSVRDDKSKLTPASKVIFVPRESELRIVNVARDERLSRDQIQNSADLNSEAALIIPVKWAEFRTKSDGTHLSLKGESVDDLKWDQRGSFEMNLPEIKSAGINEGITRLLDLEVDQNYFSFTVLNMIGNKGRKIHYSFLRADQGRTPYTPKQSFKSDQNLFGFFTSVKPFIPNFEYYTEENFNKREFISRMNPDAKEIVFHLSAGSPAWLEDIAERTVAAWDKTFQLALKDSGKVLQIRFSKDRVQLGDLRYNVIHLVETLSEDGLLGFGPSVADPETGEIISATTNVYVNSTQSIAVSTVRQYMIDRLEKRLDKNSSSEPTVLGDLSTVTTGSAEKQFTKFANSKEVIGKFSLEDVKQDLQSLSHKTCQFGEQAMLSSNDRDIQKYCPEVEKIVDQYANLDLSSREVSNANWEKVWNESKDAIKECSIKMTRGKLLSTLIHEVGHNFGLRHNFYGSYDKANFKKSTTIFNEEITAHSSSIMEYTDWDEDRLTETGNYDIAAIRFGYGEQVELKNGSIANVDVKSSLDGSKLKPYLFCSDEIAYTGLNALCKPHDAGTTPMEVVDFYIKSYQRSEALRKYRRAKLVNSDPDLIAESNAGRTFIPLKDIYDEWRYQLGEYVRKSSRYLSDFSAKDYEKVLLDMSKDPQFGPIYDQYYKASEKIYSFFKNIAFGPNEYCLIEDQGEKRAIELERLRDLLSESTRGSVAIRSCADAAAVSDLAQVLDAKAPKILAQTGYPINSYRFEKANSPDDHFIQDVVGNEKTRYYAGLIINMRMLNTRNYLNQFAPNMTDEPSHYLDFSETLMSRMTDGVDLKSFGFGDAQPLFSQEAELIRDIAIAFKEGLKTPGDRFISNNQLVYNQVVSRKKRAALTVYQPAQGDDVKQFAAVLTMNDRTLFAAIKESHVFAFNLINRFNEISSLLSIKDISTKTQLKVIEMLTKAIPTAVELPAATITDFVVVIQLMDKIYDSLASYASCYEEKTPILAQINALRSLVIDDYLVAHKAGEEAEKKFLDSNLMEYMAGKLDGGKFLFIQENLEPIQDSMSACSTTVRKMNRNRKDYEAQKSMILDVLSAYAD